MNSFSQPEAIVSKKTGQNEQDDLRKVKVWKKVKKIMTKKHQNSSKELLKKTFEATKENPNIEVNLSFNDKVIKA